MPLYTTLTVDDHARLYVWKITESYDELATGMRLKPASEARLSGMKSEQHRRGFLSVRALLHAAGYSDFDLYYDASGKPHLLDGRYISISHSFGFSAIIVSDRLTGIDLELRRDKIRLIDYKFAEHEMKYLNPEYHDDYIARLTVIWGVKEAIFKIRNEPGISFKDHIFVLPFERATGQATAELHFGDRHAPFDIRFLEIEDYTIVYAFEK
ncbi:MULTISPECIES: 4'-phosphopantetheinyl transferase superfamily protein [unclassified Flavobacterium]|uniref:4'-phosphopantetheinyl transferase family protein n=1 Tax=unclassified Flavobacterium TaxID=196869 RepID=UPI001F138266|nr:MULTISPECIES: 4'-phosphopantetheinyl transferase superfamily protein [unclassified Flavobacterium]UMY66059.1 4'-phosphopantetheinyl transferase superfamily protein [Flavobacterium sp. HJ-32-4]